MASFRIHSTQLTNSSSTLSTDTSRSSVTWYVGPAYTSTPTTTDSQFTNFATAVSTLNANNSSNKILVLDFQYLSGTPTFPAGTFDMTDIEMTGKQSETGFIININNGTQFENIKKISHLFLAITKTDSPAFTIDMIDNTSAAGRLELNNVYIAIAPSTDKSTFLFSASQPVQTNDNIPTIIMRGLSSAIDNSAATTIPIFEFDSSVVPSSAQKTATFILYDTTVLYNDTIKTNDIKTNITIAFFDRSGANSFPVTQSGIVGDLTVQLLRDTPRTSLANGLAPSASNNEDDGFLPGDLWTTATNAYIYMGSNTWANISSSFIT
jgi:hypothetical protein